MTKQIVINHLKEIEKPKYLIVGEEMHQDGETHFHAVVIYLKRLQKRGNVFSIDECVCNVQVIGNSNSDMTNAIAYVKKSNNYEFEGIEPRLQKKKDRIEKINYIKEHSLKECIETGEYTFSEIAKIQMIKNALLEKRPRNKPRRIYWFWGETGSGKTKRAIEICEEEFGENDTWLSSGDLKSFFNGYEGQSAVILDDLRAGDVKWNQLLRMLDRYRYTVNVKGSCCEWNAELIIVTSPYRPEETFLKKNERGEWSTREDIEQLLRRIDEIVKFPEESQNTQ